MYFFLSTAPLPFYDGGFFLILRYCWYLLVSFLFSTWETFQQYLHDRLSPPTSLHLPSYFLITVIFFLDIFYAIQCMPQGNFLFWLPMYPIHWWCTRNFTVKMKIFNFNVDDGLCKLEKISGYVYRVQCSFFLESIQKTCTLSQLSFFLLYSQVTPILIFILSLFYSSFFFLIL